MPKLDPGAFLAYLRLWLQRVNALSADVKARSWMIVGITAGLFSDWHKDNAFLFLSLTLVMFGALALAGLYWRDSRGGAIGER